MQFYNPFKAHIVKRGDMYAVRRYNFILFQWEYLDRKHNLSCWWLNVVGSRNSAIAFCFLGDKELAVKRLIAYREGEHDPEETKEYRIKEKD